MICTSAQGRTSIFWRDQPVFQRRKFLHGRKIRGHDIKDISWFNPAGKEMSDKDWNAGFVKCLGLRLAGDLIGDVDERGEVILGQTLLALLNAHHEPIPFVLPATKPEHHWERMFDTSVDAHEAIALVGGAAYELKERSVTLWRTVTPEEAGQVIAAPQVAVLVREPLRQPLSTATAR